MRVGTHEGPKQATVLRAACRHRGGGISPSALTGHALRGGSTMLEIT
jgi:hypothetical protein